jgi:hypothetical protein
MSPPIYLPPVPAWYMVPYEIHGEALSSEGRSIGRSLEAARDARGSVSFGRRAWDLDAAYSEASRRDWDGYGAEPISPGTYARAIEFLRSLPLTVDNPDIAADPDGEVSFTWTRGPRALFSASIGADGRLSYAGLYGESAIHGTEWFIGALPSILHASLARLFSARTAAADRRTA